MTTYNIEQYMKDLEYLVNIDCNAQNFAGIDKVADYLAKDFTIGRQNFDPDEFITLEEHTLDQAIDLIYQNKITDAKTIAALFAYKANYKIN